MDKKERAIEVVKILKKVYPEAKVALYYKTPFQLLVAVILSAQCTDKRVNLVTPVLFKKFPTVKDLANCDLNELEKIIYSTGFYKNKAKNIKLMANEILKDFKGDVPDTMEDLLKLHGVARKTANVILTSVFGKNCGIVVDTHMIRISGLLGLADKKDVSKKNAVNIEKTLMKIIPKKDWGDISFLLVNLGRNVCIARRPKCGICPLNKICPSAKV
ncbi:MAG: endonuclease III [Candidatus Gracilibacteria bacterium]|jgi:endonuclease-3